MSDRAAAGGDVISPDHHAGVTWGLLGPGKGIEWAIDSLPGLRDLRPRYLVIGKTNPKVLERNGEEYRQGLVSRAHDQGVADVVELLGDGTGLVVPQRDPVEQLAADGPPSAA